MRMVIASILLLVACGDDGGSRPPDSGGGIDAAQIVDAQIDAPIDAAIDSMPTDASIPANVTAACTNVCNKFGTCAPSSPSDIAECIDGCSEDLLDCSTQQVMDVDACAAADCGDIENKTDSPIIQCLVVITCVEM